MSAYLALKHKPPSGLLARLFHWLTAARLLTLYPHAGVVKDGVLMHSNLANGLHSEPFNAEGWHLFVLPDFVAQHVLPRFEAEQGAKYDWFSLLAFLLPWQVRDHERFYCYEWCWLALTGIKPSYRVTPEMLLAKLAHMHGGTS